ncbi:zinc ribbon domain-containing protein [Enterococcus sp. 669A]|uniref:Zinc ribbon domain-containing protein n=1 Tax=Candidatus Enterococcus moelleringii TaxID=2815325 RepID=A0ABS3L6N7_9ENTE|nr:zinc ribbon domain-containing protein [Enterococcus sp. 669A]MBO1305279.1 zinc ribbon domain-containing protein [Enterococcus sp. 669A]
MKYCPNCGAANQKDAAFCEQCGHKLTSVAEESTTVDNVQNDEAEMITPVRRTTKANQSSKVPWIIGIVVLLGVVVGGGIFFASYGNNNPEPAASRTTSISKESSSEESEETSDTVEDELSKYDEIIRDAKEMTINGEYRESSLLLASIPVSDLSKDEFRVIRDAVQDLTQENNNGIQDEKKKEMSDQAANNNSQTVSNGGFAGDLAKWANTYTFYYSQSGQKQSSLTIAANGGVTQNNYNGTQYFGKATIAGASGSILSYETNALYPSTMPNTKSIRPDVQINVQWDGGGTQTFYGYLSYSSRLALTDGVVKGAGVNEVWISY